MGLLGKIERILKKPNAPAPYKRVVEHPRLGRVTFHRRKGSKQIRLSVSARRDLLLSYPWRLSFEQAWAFLEKHESWALAALEKVRQHAQNQPPRSLKELFLLRQKAKAELPSRLAALAQQHQFSYNKLFLKNNVSNWGSCSAANNINLNLRLVLLPPHLSDYVILHELCHTRFKNHGPDFWSLLNSLTEGKAKAYAKELRAYNASHF